MFLFHPVCIWLDAWLASAVRYAADEPLLHHYLCKNGLLHRSTKDKGTWARPNFVTQKENQGISDEILWKVVEELLVFICKFTFKIPL